MEKKIFLVTNLKKKQSSSFFQTLKKIVWFLTGFEPGTHQEASLKKGSSNNSYFSKESSTASKHPAA